MSDSLLETFIRYGTNAERLAFTPNPPTVSGVAVKVLYEWRETDTGNIYVYDTTWHLASSASGVTTTGSPSSGNFAKFSGSTTITDLTAAQATAALNAMVGDSGSGGTKGLVPAPAAGDAAAGKFLKADGTFAVPGGGISAVTHTVSFVIGDGTNVVTTGFKASICVPWAATITGWSINSSDAATTSGSIALDVRKNNATNPPTTSIVAAAPPTLTTATLASSSTLTGWTTAVSAGDVIGVSVSSVSSVKQVILVLTMTGTT